MIPSRRICHRRSIEEIESDLLTTLSESLVVLPCGSHVLVIDVAQPAAENGHPVTVSHVVSLLVVGLSGKYCGPECTTREERERYLEEAGYNLFLLPALVVIVLGETLGMPAWDAPWVGTLSPHRVSLIIGLGVLLLGLALDRFWPAADEDRDDR